MKSYLRFLSRNKLYTAIEVVGLSVALAFLIVLGSILIDKSQVNDNIKDADEIYSLAYKDDDTSIGQFGAVGSFLEQIPMVKEWCRFAPCRQVKMKTESGESLVVNPMQVTSNFFSFFGLGLTHGDAEQALKVNGREMSFVSSGDVVYAKAGPSDIDSKPLTPRGNVVLSKHIADAVFPEENPIGKTISLLAEWDIHGTYTITGIAAELGKCVLPESDLYISFYEAPAHRDSYMFKPNSKRDVKRILNIIKNHKTANEYDQRYFPITEIIPFDEIKDGKVRATNYRYISDPKFTSVFTLICMIMTGLAIVALSNYYAQISRHDTAVRKVFGISRCEVFWKTVWGFVAPVLIGAGIAIPLSYIYFGRWLEAYPVRIDNSPAIYAAALAIVLTVTIGTVILQALRLMSTNPAEALKKE